MKAMQLLILLYRLPVNNTGERVDGGVRTGAGLVSGRH
jgi:hypothetical protein